MAFYGVLFNYVILSEPAAGPVNAKDDIVFDLLSKSVLHVFSP
jgi:hypothetical protein